MIKIGKFEKILAVIIFALWAIIIFILGIGKLVTDGFGTYAQHFTNWQWSIQGFFFLFDVLTVFDRTGYFSFYLVSFAFWLTNGVTWIVFILIFIVLGENPDLLINMSNRGTGTLSLGVILNMDRVFHVLPAFMILLYMFLRRDKIAFSMYFFMNDNDSGIGGRLAYSFTNMFGPILYSLFYFSINNVNEVYGITMNMGFVILIGIGVLVVFNLLPFMLFFYKYVVSNRKKSSDLKTYTNFIISGNPGSYPKSLQGGIYDSRIWK